MVAQVNKIHIGFVFLVMVFLFPTAAFGESLDSFEATIQAPASQKNKELMYYDLILDPSQTETLPVTLTNRGDKELELRLSFNRAITNSGGVVEYSGMNEDSSQTAPYNIEEVVALAKKTIKLPAKGSQTIELTVKMPEKNVAGILAGGLYIEEVSNEKVEGNIKNVFSREIAVLLRNSAKEVAPEITFGNAQAIQSNYRNMIEVEVENTKGTYLKDATLSYTVYLNDKKTEITGTKEQLNMAPNTIMKYHIPFEGVAFDSGDYRVEMEIRSGENRWSGESGFTLSPKKAKAYNKTDVTLEKKTSFISWKVMLIAGFLGLVVVSSLAGLLYRNRKLQKQLAEKNEE